MPPANLAWGATGAIGVAASEASAASGCLYEPHDRDQNVHTTSPLPSKWTSYTPCLSSAPPCEFAVRVDSFLQRAADLEAGFAPPPAYDEMEPHLFCSPGQREIAQYSASSNQQRTSGHRRYEEEYWDTYSDSEGEWDEENEHEHWRGIHQRA